MHPPEFWSSQKPCALCRIMSANEKKKKKNFHHKMATMLKYIWYSLPARSTQQSDSDSHAFGKFLHTETKCTFATITSKSHLSRSQLIRSQLSISFLFVQFSFLYTIFEVFNFCMGCTLLHSFKRISFVSFSNGVDGWRLPLARAIQLFAFHLNCASLCDGLLCFDAAAVSAN